MNNIHITVTESGGGIEMKCDVCHAVTSVALAPAREISVYAIDLMAAFASIHRGCQYKGSEEVF